MIWVKIDMTPRRHQKLLSADPEGLYLWVAGLCYSNRYHTGGLIRASDLWALDPSPRWGRTPIRKIASQLVESGLWHPHPEGWEIQDYAEYKATGFRAEVKRRK